MSLLFSTQAIAVFVECLKIHIKGIKGAKYLSLWVISFSTFWIWLLQPNVNRFYMILSGIWKSV